MSWRSRVTASATMTIIAGTQLGRYEIRSKLGAGGMGEVYLAQDTTLGRRVALKLLPVLYTQDTDRLRRFEQEARTASALIHPNIVTIAHPLYQNAGEIPVGGRGKLGRRPFFAQLDLHLNYPWAISERMKLNLIANFFNVTNSQRVRLPDQNRESFLGQLNPDFLTASIVPPAL
jgi:serine/threonine protein kinase